MCQPALRESQAPLHNSLPLRWEGQPPEPMAAYALRRSGQDSHWEDGIPVAEVRTHKAEVGTRVAQVGIHGAEIGKPVAPVGTMRAEFKIYTRRCGMNDY